MRKMILPGLLTAAITAAICVLFVVPLVAWQWTEAPSIELDQKEEGKAVLDTKVVLESDEGSPSITLMENGKPVQLGEEDVEIKEVREFPFLNLPWVESKHKAVINPSKKTTLFKPETGYTATFGDEKISFQTITLPKVVKTDPEHGAESSAIHSSVDVYFNEEVVWDDQYLVVDPPDEMSVEVGPAWKMINIIPRAHLPWKTSTTYTFTIKKGLPDKFGHELPEDFVLTFKTRPSRKVVQAWPVGDGQPLDSVVKIVFDRLIFLNAAEKSFKIEPVVSGTISWDQPITKLLAWKPAKLDYSTTYKVSVGGELSEFDPIVPYEWQFRTEDPPVVVEIQGNSQSPTTLKAVPSGGIGSYSYQWSTGETTEAISVDVPAGEVWNISVTVASGNRSASAEISVSGPALPPPAVVYEPPAVVEEPAPTPVIGEPVVQPPQMPTPGEGNKIVLTFDDSGRMDEILDVLAAYGAKAIFFPVGYWAVTVPDVIQRAIDEGHLVGNHTYNHATLTALSPEGIRQEVLGAEVGNAKLLRPPGGNGCWGEGRAYIEPIVQELGYTLYCWTIDPRDWAGTSVEYITSTILNNARPGAIVVLHLHAYNTLVALPGIIEALQAAGYTVSW